MVVGRREVKRWWNIMTKKRVIALMGVAVVVCEALREVFDLLAP